MELTIFNIIISITIFNIIMSFFTKRNIAYCGMVGFSGPDDFNVDKIKMLLLSNMIRGIHSTGMFNNNQITKESGNAVEFLSKHEIVPGKLFFAHDRHATVGGKAAENAHPFTYGKITGQHNGTLTNHWSLVRKADDDKTINDFDVDSQVLIYYLSQDNQNFDILYKFEGAAAIIWHDEDHPNRLYCFRNEKRPLFRGYIGKNMYISSIEESLKYIGCTGIKSFKTDYVYVIEDGKIILKESKYIKRKEEKLKKQTSRYSNYGYSGYGNPHNSMITRNSENDYKPASSTSSVDRTCNWAMRLNDNHGQMRRGEWFLYEDTNNNDSVYVRVYFNENHSSLIDKKNLYFPRDFTPKSYVIAQIDDKSGIFKKGEVLHLQNLEYSKDDHYTIAVLQKLNEHNKVYEWSKKFIRPAKDEELHDWINNNKESSIINLADDNDFAVNESSELLRIENEFENDNRFKDVSNRNRLSGCYFELKEVFEDFKMTRLSALETLKNLDILKDNADKSQQIIFDKANIVRIKALFEDISNICMREMGNIIDDSSYGKLFFSEENAIYKSQWISVNTIYESAIKVRANSENIEKLMEEFNSKNFINKHDDDGKLIMAITESTDICYVNADNIVDSVFDSTFYSHADKKDRERHAELSKKSTKDEK